MKEKFKMHEQVSLCVFIFNQIPVEHFLPKLGGGESFLINIGSQKDKSFEYPQCFTN